jgi:RHS repeat-associated protein
LLFENFIFSRTSLLTLQSDHDLNLYYNRARYLDVNRGRFWSQDSFEGDNEEPLSLNKYLYANANPNNNADPTGLSTVSIATASVLSNSLAGISTFRLSNFITQNVTAALSQISTPFSDLSLSIGINVARNKLTNMACKTLFLPFGDPVALLDEMVANNFITASLSYDDSIGGGVSVLRLFPSANTGAVTIGRGTVSVTVGGTRLSAARIIVNLRGFFFTGVDAKGQNITMYSEFSNLSLEQVKGAVIIHELLHAFGRIPSDAGNPTQSQQNSQTVRNACF